VSRGVLVVFAAASLTEAFQDIGAAFERAHPGVKVEFNFAGSQVLRAQIEQGAPADVFASADLLHADALAASGRTRPHRTFARNALVVVTPGGSPRVRSLRDLAAPGVKVVLAAATVPAGRYARKALERMDGDASLGAGFAERVRAAVVSEETSVRAVLAKVALGEADAGFVYATDAAAARGRVAVIALPEGLGVVATYPIAVLTRSTSPLAAAFMEEVLGAEGQAALRRRGFLP
jgi:molybdate transport system substrate-binding protein